MQKISETPDIPTSLFAPLRNITPEIDVNHLGLLPGGRRNKDGSGGRETKSWGVRKGREREKGYRYKGLPSWSSRKKRRKRKRSSRRKRGKKCQLNMDMDMDIDLKTDTNTGIQKIENETSPTGPTTVWRGKLSPSLCASPPPPGSKPKPQRPEVVDVPPPKLLGREAVVACL